jgi:hypothetical protein
MTPLLRGGGRLSGKPRWIAALLAAGATGGALVSACSSSSPPPVDTSPSGTDAGPGATDGRSGSQDAPRADALSVEDGGADTGTSLDAANGQEDSGPADAPYGGIDVNTLPEAGTFDAFVPCGILNCSTGCCASDGTCAPGTADNACGYAGNHCTDCTLQTQTCNAQTSSCH